MQQPITAVAAVGGLPQSHEVVATEPGYLAELLVALGDQVGIGAGIARQSLPELALETAQLDNRLGLLESQTKRSGGGTGAADSLLALAGAALRQLEGQRPSQKPLVSPVAGEVMTLLGEAGQYLPGGGAVAQVRQASD